MQGYMNRCLYVTTVTPTPAKFAAFWGEIYAQSCSTCVMLNELDNSYEVGSEPDTCSINIQREMDVRVTIVFGL